MSYNSQKKLELIHSVGFDRYFKANSWPEYNRAFFNGLAQKYDAANVLHSFGTKRRMDRIAVSHLRLPPQGRVLDLCTGSGDIALEIARQYPGVQIIGVDAAEEMLKIARRRAEGFGGRIEFIEGDALALPFPDGFFDAVVISYGLRNLADLNAGLTEMFRLVRPGGIVSNIDQGKPTNRLFKLVYAAYFYRIAPLIGKVVFHLGEFNSFRYLPESNRFFPSQEELCAIFKEVGFEELQNYDYWCGAVAQQTARRPAMQQNL